MIDIEARKRGDMEMERVKLLLDNANIDWEQRGEGTPIVQFDNGTGDCWVFPSQTYDGKLCVRFVRKVLVDTADEALRSCGVID